jgi:hypothetical protein
MESNKNVLELLDVLYAMVTDAWSVPLGNDKCIIEREKAVALINDIKANLPSSVAEAQRLVNARDEFIGNAKREAEALRKNAEEQARTMVEEQEIVRVARAQSAEMLSAAEAKSNELRRVASQYVDDIIRQTVENLNGALTTVKSVQTSLHNVNPQPKPQQESEEEANPLPVTSNIIIEQRPAE